MVRNDTKPAQEAFLSKSVRNLVGGKVLMVVEDKIGRLTIYDATKLVPNASLNKVPTSEPTEFFLFSYVGMVGGEL